METAVYSLVGKPDGQFKVRGIIESVDGFYDFILIDCPPSLGILSVNALTASDEIIIVAVSYTHLDVYKERRLGWLKGRC